MNGAYCMMLLALFFGWVGWSVRAAFEDFERDMDEIEREHVENEVNGE